jgi:hypothetical protein
MAVECVAGSHVAPEERFDYFGASKASGSKNPTVAVVVKVVCNA